MDNPLNINGYHRCDTCNKEYSSYKSLWNHNKKFHSTKQDLDKKNQEKTFYSKGIVKNEQDKQYFCKFCNKSFSYKQSKYDHQKNYCKEKNNESKIKDMEIQLKIKDQELLIKEQEKEILKLKLKLQKSKKADTVTVNQLNKLLVERDKQIKEYMINYGNIQNNVHNGDNIVNNFQLVGFSKEEDIVDLLTNKEKKQIIDARYKCLEKFIEIIHCGKYDKFKNILITNIKDNYMYKFDDVKGQFVLATKEDVLNTLINNRMYELETIYDDFLEQNKLDETTKDIIEKFINKINYNDSKFIDSDGKEHENYKKYKINEIKLILYNNQDKITNDISLLLTTSNVEI